MLLFVAIRFTLLLWLLWFLFIIIIIIKIFCVLCDYVFVRCILQYLLSFHCKMEALHDGTLLLSVASLSPTICVGVGGGSSLHEPFQPHTLCLKKRANFGKPHVGTRAVIE